MPFTPSHAVLVLAVRRLPIVVSAFVIGAMAPDFEYFVRMVPLSRWGHHFPGVLLFTLPVALLVLWLYQSVVKRVVLELLPEGVQRRLPNGIDRFEFRGHIGAILLSVSVGIATHIAWDLFTHRNTLAYWKIVWLREEIALPLLGTMGMYKVLQHTSTLGGLTIWSVWGWRWYRRTEPQDEWRPERHISESRKARTVAIMFLVAINCSLAWAWYFGPVPDMPASRRVFAAIAFCSGVTFLWAELLAYGLVTRGKVARTEVLAGSRESLRAPRESATDS